MTMSFAYEALPMRVVFGAGTLDRLPSEVDRLGIDNVLVLCSARQGGTLTRVSGFLGSRMAGAYDGAPMHVPVEAVEAARVEAERVGANGLVAIGGGSAIGLAKAVAKDAGLPIVAVPTTYAGSEMTPVWGVTAAGVKTTAGILGCCPAAVIYDPDLTGSMPISLRVTAASTQSLMPWRACTRRTRRPSCR